MSKVQCKILKLLMVKSTVLVSLKIGHQKINKNHYEIFSIGKIQIDGRVNDLD